jgi:hypothetical protein
MTALPFPEDVRDRVTSYIQHQGAKPPDAIHDLVSASHQRFLDVVSGLADDVASRKPAPGEWSVRELICHVIDAERGVRGLVHNLSRGEPPARDRGPGLMIEDTGQPFAWFVDHLRALNEDLLREILAIPANPNVDLKAPHPFFGPLNGKEWAAFQRVHDEDHIQHAQKILAAVTARG